MEAAKDRVGLSNFLRERLEERYVLPLRVTCKKNGFLMMAVSCLLIETLESFYQGWEDTSEAINRNVIKVFCRPDPKRSTVSASEVSFCYFFQRHSAFSALRPYAQRFYVNVRCGILHQGETTGGWRVLRKGGLMFDPSGLVINASRFFNEVGKALAAYVTELQEADWDAEVWKSFMAKMNTVIQHCIPTRLNSI